VKKDNTLEYLLILYLISVIGIFTSLSVLAYCGVLKQRDNSRERSAFDNINKKMNQQDFDEAIKRLPSPTEIDTDIYIIPSINTGCRFVFRKEHFYISPQGKNLVMWVLKEIRYL
jgi:hypothetical protein